VIAQIVYVHDGGAAIGSFGLVYLPE